MTTIKMKKYACRNKLRKDGHDVILSAFTAEEAASSWAQSHANFAEDPFGNIYVSVATVSADGEKGPEETYRVEVVMVPKFVASKIGW